MTRQRTAARETSSLVAPIENVTNPLPQIVFHGSSMTPEHACCRIVKILVVF